MEYSLPKIWMGRIQKYWDKFVPTGFPVSSSKFSVKYENEEIKTAVETMENTIGTEDSPIAEIIPENSFVSEYLGTYDVEGTPGELTLLSPVKVNDNNIIALHYNSENKTWNQIEDVQIIDGYAWGVLESFSPIAIIKCRKEIHIEESIENMGTNNFIICEGNPVTVTYDDGKSIVTNGASGKSIEIDGGGYTLIGGTADGTPIESTSIIVLNQISSKNISKVIAGSLNCVSKEPTTVNEVNLYIRHSAFSIVTGSMGAVRTNKVNFEIFDSTITYVGAGEGFKNYNTPPASFTSISWAKSVNIYTSNSKIFILYSCQNCEIFYVDKSIVEIDNGSKIDYLLGCGSNDGATDVSVKVVESEIGIYQSTNRGFVKSSSAKFIKSKVKNLFVGGDATDKTVTGKTGEITIEIDAGDGEYNIVTGTENGKLITAEDAERIVKYVKVSRNTSVKISDELKTILGSKYIVK